MDLENVKIEWGDEKNEKIKCERGISFEDIEEAIRNGEVVAVFDHPNQVRYP